MRADLVYIYIFWLLFYIMFGFTLWCRVLEDVGFEEKFDQLPEFHPSKDTRTPVPQSPRVYLAGMRKKKAEYGDSPASTPHRVSGGSR